MAAPYWAVARLKTGQEGLALHSLTRIGYVTYFPRTIERRTIRGRQIVRVVALFPSYVFVQIEAQWHAARWAYGVAALILDGSVPAKVPEHEIASLRSRERDGFIVLQPPPKPRSLRRGDSVRVIAGPLIGFNGLVEGMASRDRIILLLRMLGGPQRVTLPKGDVAAV